MSHSQSHANTHKGLSMPSCPPVLVSRVFRARILLLTRRDQVTERRGCWRCRNELWAAPPQPWMVRLSRRDRGHCRASLTQHPRQSRRQRLQRQLNSEGIQPVALPRNISSCLSISQITVFLFVHTGIYQHDLKEEYLTQSN